MNTENINFEKLAVAIINSFESDREESGRKEIVSGMKHVLKKYQAESERRVIDDMLITFTGWSLESLLKQAEDISDEELEW